MQEKYLILSDIHGNLSAFDAVLKDCASIYVSGIIILGDIIDYGMRSNEIIRKLVELEEGIWKNKIIVNIWGNHEKLVIDKNLDHLSSERGRKIAQFTASQLSQESIKYINGHMNKMGLEEFDLKGLKCLAVHGSLEDNYWKAIEPDNIHGDYIKYDVVISGHSHFSHCFTHFYPAEMPELRNKKAVTFINPGSVGQPRNQNPCAQYALYTIQTKSVELRAVSYNVAYEQSLYPEEIDDFYKIRLARGI